MKQIEQMKGQREKISRTEFMLKVKNNKKG